MRETLAIATVAALMISAGPALAQRSATLPPPAGIDMRPSDPSRPARASMGPMTGAAMATITATVIKQIQPCADRQIVPAPEASEILTMVQLNLNRDGSLAGVRILSHQGLTGANQRWVPRVDDAIEAIFTGCTPILGLPLELYDVPGGWRSLQFRYRLKA